VREGGKIQRQTASACLARNPIFDWERLRPRAIVEASGVTIRNPRCCWSASKFLPRNRSPHRPTAQGAWLHSITFPRSKAAAQAASNTKTDPRNGLRPAGGVFHLKPPGYETYKGLGWFGFDPRFRGRPGCSSAPAASFLFWPSTPTHGPAVVAGSPPRRFRIAPAEQSRSSKLSVAPCRIDPAD